MEAVSILTAEDDSRTMLIHVQHADYSIGDDIPAGLASTAELMLGFLAASMPIYRPLYRRLRYGHVRERIASAGIQRT